VNRLSLVSESLGSSLARQPFAIDLFLMCYAFKFVFSGSVLCYSSFEPIPKEILINVVMSHCCNTCVQRGQEEVVHSTFTSHSLTTESSLALASCSHILPLVPPFSKRNKGRVLAGSFAVLSLKQAFNPSTYLTATVKSMNFFSPTPSISHLLFVSLCCILVCHGTHKTWQSKNRCLPSLCSHTSIWISS